MEIFWVGFAGKITLLNGSEADADSENTDGGFCEDYYFIVTDKCTECKGFRDEPHVQLLSIKCVFQTMIMLNLKRSY